MRIQFNCCIFFLSCFAALYYVFFSSLQLGRINVFFVFLFGAEHLKNVYRFSNCKILVFKECNNLQQRSNFSCVAECISVHIYHSENYYNLLHLFCTVLLMLVQILKNTYIYVHIYVLLLSAGFCYVSALLFLCDTKLSIRR